MYSALDTAFEDYLLNIALTKTQSEIIESAMEDALALFLSEYGGNADIYAQGSYAMGTTVRPLTELQAQDGIPGEYDIDIAIQRSGWAGARDSLVELRRLLETTYGETKVDTKLRETCERVIHNVSDDTGISFHVDYVPIKISPQRQAPKRSKDEWFDSDTKAVVEWFESHRDYYTYIPACILVIKRSRDFAGLTNDLSSIIITTLVCEFYEDKGSYADDVLNIFSKMLAKFDVPFDELTVVNPVINENLAARLDAASQKRIINFLRGCVSGLTSGFDANDYSIIQSVLSTSFPSDPNKYPSFLESLRGRGWGIELDGTLQRKSITEDFGRGHHIRKSYRKFFGAGEKLRFIADSSSYSKAEFGIRWQVLNSVQSGEKNRRGLLFKARGANGVEGSSSNEFINHETEEYNGEHWIKYFVYSKSTHKVVEVGSKFYVGVEKV